MSFALYASPVDFNENEKASQSTAIEKRRQNRSKTYKKRDNFSSDDRVSRMQSKLGLAPMESDDSDMASFNPPPPAESVGAMRRAANDPMDDIPVQPASQEFTHEGSVTQENFTSLPSTANEDYYRQFVPNLGSAGDGLRSKDELINKLDYLIYMLEEQKDMRTGHVTEEIILYSFLGIFIIFVLDSFARAGKYSR